MNSQPRHMALVRAADAQGEPKRIVLCGSMTFYGAMIRMQDTLAVQGVLSSLPDAEDERAASMTPEQYDWFKRKVSLAHLRRVRHRTTFGILVLNLDKRGMRDYIGPSTFAEIAMASAFNKRVYLLGGYPQAYSDELAAWGVTALDGHLDRLVMDYLNRWSPSPQLSMFSHG